MHCVMPGFWSRAAIRRASALQRLQDNTTVNNISYNGGPSGVNARPTQQEQAAGRQPRHAATSEQSAQATGAKNQHDLLAAVNQGHPAVAATPRPNTFSGAGVVAARSATRNTSAPPHPQSTAEPPRRLAQAAPPPPPPERPAPAERPAPEAQERSPRHEEPKRKPQPAEPPRP